MLTGGRVTLGGWVVRPAQQRAEGAQLGPGKSREELPAYEGDVVIRGGGEAVRPGRG